MKIVQKRFLRQRYLRVTAAVLVAATTIGGISAVASQPAGAAAPAASPSSLSFAASAVGVTTSVQTVTASGASPFNVTSVRASGAGFATTADTCTGATGVTSCSVGVTFTSLGGNYAEGELMVWQSIGTTALTVALSGSPSSSYETSYESAVNSDANLAAYWPMDDSSGVSEQPAGATATPGGARDASGNGDTGALTSLVYPDQPGGAPTAPVASSMNFNNQDYNTLGLGSGASFVTTSTSFSDPKFLTLEAWFYMTTPTSSGETIAGFSDSKLNPTGASKSDRELYVGTDGKLYFGVACSASGSNCGGGGNLTINSTATVSSGAWHYAVGTYDNTGKGSMALYLDGAQVASLAGVTGGRLTPESYAAYATVGASNTTSFYATWPNIGNAQFVGDIAQVAFYTAAMTSTEVSTHYADGISGGKFSGVSPVSTTFPNTGLGSTSSAQTVTFSVSSGSGYGPVTVSLVSLEGADPADFAVSADGCTGQIVAAGSNCTVQVKLSPQAAGQRDAWLVFTDNGDGGGHVAILSGATPNAYATAVEGSSPQAFQSLAEQTGVTSADSSGNAMTMLDNQNTAMGEPSGLSCAPGSNSLGFPGSTTASTMGYGIYNTPSTYSGPLGPTSMGSAGTGKTSMTVEAWFNIASWSSGGNDSIIGNDQPDVTGSGFQLVVDNGGAGGYFEIGVGGTTFDQAAWSGYTVQTNTWYQYVGTYNAFSGTPVKTYLFKEGAGTTPVAQASAGTPGDIMYPGNYPVTVGVTPGAYTDDMGGFISNTSLWYSSASAAGALSLAAVQSHYTAAASCFTVNSSSLFYPLATLGLTSATRTVTFTNTTVSSETPLSAVISGTNASDFSKTSDTCTSPLASNGTCAVGVAATPGAFGGRAATLTVLLTSGVKATVSLFSTVADPYSTAVMADSPLAYWRFDEPSGTTLWDSSSNANTSGANTGFPSGNVAFGQSGAIGSAATETAIGLDGTTNSLVMNSTSMTGFAPTYLTVESWFELTGVSTNQSIVANGDPETGGFNKGFDLVINSGGGGGYFAVGNGAAMKKATWTSTLSLNTWYQYVGQYDGSTGVLSTYLDGVAIGAGATLTSKGAISAVPSSVGVAVGEEPNVGNNFVAGNVDDVSVYSGSSAAVLSATRIAAHYAAAVGSFGVEGPTALSWNATLGPTNQNVLNNSALSVVDTTTTSGSGNGWRVAITSTQFAEVGGATLPTGGLVLNGSATSATATTAPTTTCTTSCGGTPVSTDTYPVIVPAGASPPTPMNIYDTNQGRGTWQLGTDWWLTVPATATAGTYSSTLTLQALSGP